MMKISASYKIVTPMFLGDGLQKAESIRPPSIKGALRFWWRALNWRAVVGKNAEKKEALKELHSREARLFGLAAKEGGEPCGQGLFLLSVDSDVSKGTFVPGKGCIYMLGQGLIEKQKLKRDFLEQGGTFTIKLCFKPKATKDDMESVVEAMFIFGLLGGLGSRSRRGLGSVAIQSFDKGNTALKDIKVPKNPEEMKTFLEEALDNRVKDLPPFTAFSNKSIIDYVKQEAGGGHEDPLNLLNKVGTDFVLYRSFGGSWNGYRIEEKPAEQNFKGDHDLVLDAINRKEIDKHPDRVVFGLPHNYFFSNNKEADIAPSKEDMTRRASPLFFHVHSFPDKPQNPIVVRSFLPADFWEKVMKLKSWKKLKKKKS